MEDKSKTENSPLAPMPVPSKTSRAPGPRSVAGKERSKRNATRHGIFADILLPNESRQEFDSLWSGLRAYFDPVGTLEEVLVEKIAWLLWRMRRHLIAETGELAKNMAFLERDPFLAPQLPEMDLFIRYGASLDRALERALIQLQRAQMLRRGLRVLHGTSSMQEGK